MSLCLRLRVCPYVSVSLPLALRFCIYASAATTLNLNPCLYFSDSTSISLRFCLYVSVSTALPLCLCLYFSVSTAISLRLCIYFAVSILTEKTPIIWSFTPKSECKHSSFSLNSENSNVNTYIPALTLIIGCTLSFFKCVHSKLGVDTEFLRVHTQT